MPPYQQPNPYQPAAPYTPPAPQQPAQPAFDPAKFKEEVVSDLAATVKDMLQPQQPAPTQQPQQPAPQQGDDPQYFKSSYNSYGELEKDTMTLVEGVVNNVLQQNQQQQAQTEQTAQQRQAEYDKAIDTELDKLRGAGYLPAVANPFDENDPGKQAQNELIGYALALGTTKLDKAAQELKKHHDSGEVFDYRTNQFVKPQQAQPAPAADMFGNPGGELPPAAPAPQPVGPQQPYPPQPQYAQPAPYGQPAVSGYGMPVGPQNPYMPGPVAPSYPPGFNAPVSTGGSFMGVQNQTPDLRTVRNMSYDQMVETFNRTQ